MIESSLGEMRNLNGEKRGYVVGARLDATQIEAGVEKVKRAEFQKAAGSQQLYRESMGEKADTCCNRVVGNIVARVEHGSKDSYEDIEAA